MALNKKVLRCDCGFEVVAETDEELAVGIRRHALEAHRMQFTAEDALLVALRAEIDGLSASDDNEREE
jgi:predicted small metal-binding protein